MNGERTHSADPSCKDPEPSGGLEEIRQIIDRKPSLRTLYSEIYGRFARCLEHCPSEGIALELGSGAGFLKEVIPDVVTSDVVKDPRNDLCVDARKMPFPDQSLRAIFMFNVFHHIPDVAAFLREADRCLMPGGRIFMVDQNLGPISYPILKYLHHEPIDRHAEDWAFESSGPMSGANGALAWMVFRRDSARLRREYPNLRLLRYEPHTPFRYWWSGGLKRWSLLPRWAFGFATRVDRALCRIWPILGSFVDVELVRVRPALSSEAIQEPTE
jgi:SAM-dependent methyltransferase